MMEHYWSKETELALKHFRIKPHLKWPIDVIRALIIIKAAAAKTHQLHDKIPSDIAQVIYKSSKFIYANEDFINKQFMLPIWQSGSGTQMHMNVNEVIANYSNHTMHKKAWIDPHDHVNYGQSTNDVMITAIHMAILWKIPGLIKVLANLQLTFLKLTKKYGSIIKVGRTHWQDAVPLSYKQEWSGYLAVIDNLIKDLKYSQKNLGYIPIGGTAVGTGINSYPQFSTTVCKILSDETGLVLSPAANFYSKISVHMDVAFTSGILNNIAQFAQKLSHDFSILSSGPDCGINEILFYPNEPGSSIMAGKSNPTQCEMLSMAALDVMGQNFIISAANANSVLQLNTYRPLMAYHIINMFDLLTSALSSWNDHFLTKIKINIEQNQKWQTHSKMITTKLVPVLGYDKVTELIKYAQQKQLAIKEAILKLDLLTPAEMERLLDPAAMISVIDNEWSQHNK